MVTQMEIDAVGVMAGISVRIAEMEKELDHLGEFLLHDGDTYVREVFAYRDMARHLKRVRNLTERWDRTWVFNDAPYED